MELQKVGRDWVTEQQQHIYIYAYKPWQNPTLMIKVKHKIDFIPAPSYQIFTIVLKVYIFLSFELL